MDFRMQRFHAPVHDLGKARHVGDIGDREAGVAKRLRGAAGREQHGAVFLQAAGEFDQAGLVGNGQERAADGAERHGLTWNSGFPAVLTSGPAKREVSEADTLSGNTFVASGVASGPDRMGRWKLNLLHNAS